MTSTFARTLPELDLTVGDWAIDPYHSSVLFSIRHLGLAKVRGRFQTFDATLHIGETIGETSVESSIELGSINTNSTDRDAHLLSTDFFSAETHPQMVFRSTGLAGAGSDWTLAGDLTLNGITQPVVLEMEFNGAEVFPKTGNLHAGFSATGTIKRSQFGIDFGIMPLGVDRLALADDVRIELDLEFVQPAS